MPQTVTLIKEPLPSLLVVKEEGVALEEPGLVLVVELEREGRGELEAGVDDVELVVDEVDDVVTAGVPP